jgi:protein-arginine deiminase
MGSQIDTVYSNQVSAPFIHGLDTAATASGVGYWRIEDHMWRDHWTEDYFQTGFSSIPWADGQVHGMRVKMPRPWGRNGENEANLPWTYLLDYHVYPDAGAVKVYDVDHSGDSYDSYGNHDLIPPYVNGDQSYPYGRIVYGSGVLPETKAFYEAQQVQAPALTLDTSWLIVGHIDEVFSYVPAATERGWKLMVGSPRLAREMLQNWQAQGRGSELMFSGRRWSDGSNAAVTIDDALADQDLMAWSQQGQAEIDTILGIMQAEVGLSDDEIIEIPFLMEQDYGLLVAHNPGTVNSLVFGNTIVVPDPFGPMIDGVDGFKQDLLDRLATPALGVGYEGQGLAVFFADDWDWYHALLGEVHCDTNQDGPPAAEVKWWEAIQ